MSSQDRTIAPNAGTVPIWAPYYGASMRVAAQRFFKKYAIFSGRASRSEYWWWALISAAVSTVFSLFISIGLTLNADSSAALGTMAIVGYALSGLWFLATIVPGLALTARRLHDGDFSAWWMLVVLVPVAGQVVLLILTLMPSKPEGQRFDVPSPAWP